MPVTKPEQPDIIKEIEAHRQAILELEEKLRRVETAAKVEWPPREFYVTFYIVAGCMIGLVGAMASFIFNLVGSVMVAQDPMLLLRVIGTFFQGEKALTTADMNFLILVLLVHFSVGAVGGAIYHVVINRYFETYSGGKKILLGVAWGLVIWLVNFYGIISWVQPLTVGKAFILDMMPAWVAALTHAVYGITLGLLQPFGRFIAYKPAQ